MDLPFVRCGLHPAVCPVSTIVSDDWMRLNVVCNYENWDVSRETKVIK